jgi:two-component system sensor histidine kinase MtrB
VPGRGLASAWGASAPVVEDVEGTVGPADLPSVTGGIPVVLPRDAGHDRGQDTGSDQGRGNGPATDLREVR